MPLMECLMLTLIPQPELILRIPNHTIHCHAFADGTNAWHTLVMNFTPPKGPRHGLMAPVTASHAKAKQVWVSQFLD